MSTNYHCINIPTTGLHININKTKEMRVNTSSTQKFSLEDTGIEEAESFVYLGSVVSKTRGTEEDVSSRIKKANGVFVQLYPIWRNHNISKRVKIRIFNTNVKSVLLYACETWKTTNQITRRLQIFVNNCLRQIMNMKLFDRITNEDLWSITQQETIENQIKKRIWNWIGHTLHKETGAIDKTALDWNPQGYRRSRPKRMWRRTIEDEIRGTRRSWNEVKGIAGDCINWKLLMDALCSTRSKWT
jgi:hypothetical protein